MGSPTTTGGQTPHIDQLAIKLNRKKQERIPFRKQLTMYKIIVLFGIIVFLGEVEGSNRCYRGQGDTENTETCTESRWCIKVTGSGNDVTRACADRQAAPACERVGTGGVDQLNVGGTIKSMYCCSDNDLCNSSGFLGGPFLLLLGAAVINRLI